MAGFMEMPVEDFRNHLLAFKHKMKNVVWTKVICPPGLVIDLLTRAPLVWRESSSLEVRSISSSTKT